MSPSGVVGETFRAVTGYRLRAGVAAGTSGAWAVVKSGIRQCSRNGCRNAAVATLTYVYKDQTAVLGPLSATAEPHTYDLCAPHSERLTAPRGWEVVRLAPAELDTTRYDDDIAALADAVREAAATPVEGRMRTAAPEPVTGPSSPDSSRRSHLRMVREAGHAPE